VITKQWYICLSENVFGPIDTETVQLMVQQNRLQYHDYIWTVGLSRWTPMFAIAELAGLAPPYPKTPIPTPAKPTAPPQPAGRVPRDSAPKLRAVIASAPTKPAVAGSPIRISNRVVVSGHVKVEGAGEYQVIDLSVSGIFVACSMPLTIGAEIKFALSLHGLEKTLEMTGIVVRRGSSSQSVQGYAFEFVRPNPASLRILTEYVNSHKLGKTG
jgi:hypothetical protein